MTSTKSIRLTESKISSTILPEHARPAPKKGKAAIGGESIIIRLCNTNQVGKTSNFRPERCGASEEAKQAHVDELRRRSDFVQMPQAQRHAQAQDLGFARGAPCEGSSRISYVISTLCCFPSLLMLCAILSTSGTAGSPSAS